MSSSITQIFLLKRWQCILKHYNMKLKHCFFKKNSWLFQKQIYLIRLLYAMFLFLQIYFLQEYLQLLNGQVSNYYPSSSIVNEVIRVISSLFIFVLRKNFKRTKTRHKQKPTYKAKLSKQKTTKATIFHTHKNF